MKGLRALLRIAALATWLLLQGKGEGRFALASSAQDDDQFELQHSAVTETQEEQPLKSSVSALAPSDTTILNAASSKISFEKERVSGLSLKAPPGYFFYKKSSLIARPWRVFVGLAFILAILILARQNWLVFQPFRGTPPELALELKNALALLHDAKGLATAVATKEAWEAHRRALEFVSQAHKASSLADAKAGSLREQAIVQLRSQLKGALDAIKILHEGTKQAGAKASEELLLPPSVSHWCESMSRVVGDSSYLMAVGIVLMSSESSAGLISERGKSACQQLESQTFSSMADGEVLRQALKNYLALQEATEEVYAFSEWSEEVQNNALKALIDEQKIKRTMASQLLVEDLRLAHEACTYFLQKALQEPPADADKTEFETGALQYYEFMQRARQNFATLFDAHNKAVLKMASSIDPEEYIKLQFEAKLLESSMKALVSTLWGYADSYGSDPKAAESKEWFGRRKMLMECRLLTKKVEAYRQYAMEKVCAARDSLRKLFSFGQANAPGYFLTPRLMERVLALFNYHELVVAEEQRLGKLVSTMKQWRSEVGLSADLDTIMERKEEHIAEVETEARKMIGLCQEVFKVHMEVMLLINLQKFMSASTYTIERLRPLIPEGSGEAARAAEEILKKFNNAKGLAESGSDLIVVAEAAATIGLAAAELGNLVFKND